MGFPYFLVAKLSPESCLLRPQGSGSEVSGFISAGQAQIKKNLRKLLVHCKLLRIYGKPGVGVCKVVQLLQAPSLEISEKNDVAALISSC